MLVNNKNHKNTEVNFVSYTGRWPNLCSGELTLEIRGKKYTFGWCGCDFPVFWHTGGYIESDYSGSVTGEWHIDVNELPEQFRDLAEEIDRVFNENVDWGCCGGCI